MLKWQIFAEGGAAPGATGGSFGGAESPTAQAEQGATAQPEQGVAVPVQDTGKEFSDFMRLHKDEADAWFQERFDKRHRDAKSNAEKLSALDPVLRLLGEKYGWDHKKGDINDLVSSIRNDDSYYEEESYRTGIPVEQLKRNRELEDRLYAAERERDEYKARAEGEVQAIQRQQALARLQNEAEQVKAAYPGFDLRAEMQNPQFQRMVKAGVPLQAAYQAAHFDQLTQNALTFTANTVAQGVANSVQANGRRPRENGSSGHASGTAHTDVNRLSRAEFDELKRRAARGEKITL